jgi:class 3 adenylate cyclase
MRNLPSGTLTFFFSDIEGSTRLLEALGDRYSPLLERHRSIVRAAFGRDGGQEVNTQGDSFFAVFPEARAAIAAAVEIQRAMGAEPWPDGTPIRIRIGLHTGQARLVAGDYVGLDVHRAARIMAAAHGGEIVASAATCHDTGDDVTDGIRLRDLGEHRLRDLSAAERLYQVMADGLEADFPPLRTLDRTPNNLPTQPTALIGRDAELERIRRHLDSTRVRLLTLTGPGGIGKTRLALQAAANQADRVQDGVYFVDLTEADDSSSALRAIARALGLTARAGADLRAALAEQIGERDLLVVLDNFEQVMAAADDVADLLRLCPHLRVIVTSRESLRGRGAQLIAGAPRSFPGLV